MNSLTSPVLKILFFGFALSCQASSSLATDPKPRDEAWMKMHRSFNELSVKGEAPLVFLGDAITQLWARKGRKVWEEAWAPLKAVDCR